ncbi:unnamed protein product [Lathyrus sativus]|nr:unnamed protein product [Lathyrus sativus]
MQSQPNSPIKPMNSLTQIFQNIFSDNSNIMLAAIISLLLVILFVLLLHLYAKWFLAQAHAQAQARRRRRRRTTVTVSDVLGPARFHHFHSFNIEDSPLSSSHTKGLDSSIIASIPLFIYTQKNETQQDEKLECVICLSGFENGEMGRCLPKCGHGFHVECIDMWLSSHSNCPICRASIVVLENDDSCSVEIVIEGSSSSEIRGSEQGNDNDNGIGRVSGSVSDQTSSSLFGCYLKTVFSKVFKSSNVIESES